MAYQLGIDTHNSFPHPSFRYDTLEEARKAATDAISVGYHKIAGSDITIQTGPGTIYKVISEEHLAAEEPPLAPYNYVLLAGNASGQIPLGFHSAEAMASAVLDSLGVGWLFHCGKEGHEYTYFCGAPGCIYMELTKSKFLERQHMIAVEMQRQKENATKTRILHPVRG
jgi:hypothetical protein